MTMTRKYLGESHKEYSEACQKAVERMSELPYSHEQCLEQVERLRKASELQGEKLREKLSLSPEMKEMIDNPVFPTEQQLENPRIKHLLDENFR